MTTHVGAYETGATILRDMARSPAPVLVLFLGSNIGNFDPPLAAELLQGIGAAARPGDGLLLGADLVKPEQQLIEAYDDPLGVTAAFNLNLLARINRELGGTFDLSAWRHRALWNAEASRIEMHLEATRGQRVRIASLDLDCQFESGDRLWTESSYKYEPPIIDAMLHQAGFAPERQWIEDEAKFCLTLSRKPHPR